MSARPDELMLTPEFPGDDGDRWRAAVRVRQHRDTGEQRAFVIFERARAGEEWVQVYRDNVPELIARAISTQHGAELLELLNAYNRIAAICHERDRGKEPPMPVSTDRPWLCCTACHAYWHQSDRRLPLGPLGTRCCPLHRERALEPRSADEVAEEVAAKRDQVAEALARNFPEARDA